jgi:hypothetical protein
MDNNKNRDIEVNKKILLEFLWFPVFGFGWLFFEINIKHMLHGKATIENYEFLLGSVSFGLLHILASNALSFLYNLSRHILPFLKPPLATPRRLKIIGLVIIAGSLLYGVKM